MSKKQEVELNFFYLHWRDAQFLARCAKENDASKLRSLYARHAILASIFAVEAMTNKIVDDYYLLPSGRKSFLKLGIRDRIFSIPLVCGKDKPIGRTIDQSKEPFQSFSELVEIRNWLVHPKGGTFIAAKRYFGSIHVAKTGEEVPFIETDFGSKWKHTHLPVNPFEWTGDHAQQAIDICDKLISEIKLLFGELLSDQWFDEIIIKSADGSYSEKGTIQSLWGGYTPDKESFQAG